MQLKYQQKDQLQKVKIKKNKKNKNKKKNKKRKKIKKEKTYKSFIILEKNIDIQLKHKQLYIKKHNK